ncbi:MAG: PD-(D/E)XK nuclease family protein [Desulfobacteraceae bacterium]|nr:PD-(D/E)XK nuclease family protein [Desulfobacteraceae bacterium]
MPPAAAMTAVTAAREEIAAPAGAPRQITIGVRALVAHGLRTGDLEAGFLGSARPLEAIRAHQRIQRSRPTGYAPEVAVSHRVDASGFRLQVTGRIDGVYQEGGRSVVEEIKTTTGDMDAVLGRENPLHWGQVKVYAFLYALAHGLSTVVVQLTYCQLDSGEVRSIPRLAAAAELRVFFDDLVGRYLQWARTLADWQARRDASLAGIGFPYADYRAGQREMAVAVYRAVQNGDQLLVEAPTGIGKTMAALFAALKALAGGPTEKIFYLTARTTGRAAAEKAFAVLRRGGACVKSLTITAKEKICFNPGRACSPEECSFASGYYDRLNGAIETAFGQDAFTREFLETVATAESLCPFEFSLDLSRFADCIICDYNYAFDPRVYLRRFFGEENGVYTFLVDEAHNLVDRSREMFSAELRKAPLMGLRRSLSGRLPAVLRALNGVNNWFLEARRSCQEGTNPRAEESPPAGLLPRLQRFAGAAQSWLTQNTPAPFRQEMLEAFFIVSGFLRVAERFDATYATCYERLGTDVKVRLFCLDPAPQLAEALQRCRSVVFFSATLTPAGYFEKIFGCRRDARRLRLPSPFAPQHLGVFATAAATYYRQRSRTAPAVAHGIETLVTQRKGNYLVFFPSYDYLELVRGVLNPSLPGVEVISQRPAMSEAERETFLERFDLDNPATLVGLAVLGGVFGEGVDLVGERLCGVAVVGVGLPGVSLERELIRTYFESRGELGFENAYLYPGINRVLQAAGRVIRSEDDRGVVVLMDQRFTTARYATLLPAVWRPLAVPGAGQLAWGLRSFWEANT